MVGLGDTTKKIQKMIDAAEELYAKMNELRAQMNELREKVETTSRKVDGMEHDLAEQRALLEALASEQGIDVEAVLADAAIEEVEVPVTEEAEGDDQPDAAAGGSAAEPED